MANIQDTLRLPCGATLPNRLAKSAMTEGLANAHNHATQGHEKLYQRWSQGGAGLLLTGNVQIDRRYLERPGNVVIDGCQSKSAFKALQRFAKAGTVGGNHLWMQISHAGRQTPMAVNREPVGPSNKKLAMPGAQFGRPRALQDSELQEIVARFAHGAGVAQDAGFTGVQIHGAHGYLLSSFLSPDVNTRTDAWGGDLQGRSRLLREVVRAVRHRVGKTFPIGVKLNSADFQRGGFQPHDAVAIAKLLEADGVDLLEISGGTYEQPRLVGFDEMTLSPQKSEKRRESTIAREAYFLAYAEDIRKAVKMPLMVTGGFRSLAGMNAALNARLLDVIGLARPFCTRPDIAQALLEGKADKTDAYEQELCLGKMRLLSPASPIALVKVLNGWGMQGWFCLQLLRMGQGKNPDTTMGLLQAFMKYQKNERTAAAAYKAADIS